MLLLPSGDARIDPLRSGLEAAGVRVYLGWPDDRTPGAGELVVAAAQDADRALQVPARAHLLLGRVRSNRLHPKGRHGVPLLIRGTVTRPETVVPISPPAALRYYLSRMSSPPKLTGRLRNRAFVALSRGPVAAERLMPESALATLVTEEARTRPVPALVRAAHALGVPPDAQWVLALGRGDDLQRSVFHLLHHGERRWVLKFARVPGAADSFARDEAGLALVQVRRGNDRSSRTHSPGESAGRRTQWLSRERRARPALTGVAREAAVAADRPHRRLGPADEHGYGGPGSGASAGAPPARPGSVARLAPPRRSGRPGRSDCRRCQRYCSTTTSERGTW